MTTIKTTTAANSRSDGRPTYEERQVERRPTSVTYRETKDGLEVSLELPGASAEEIDVRVKGRKLTVTFEREEETRGESGGRETIETRTHRLTREVELPVDVDGDRTDAVYRDGVLKLTLAKRG